MRGFGFGQCEGSQNASQASTWGVGKFDSHQTDKPGRSAKRITLENKRLFSCIFLV
jgi:hypothetical protein